MPNVICECGTWVFKEFSKEFLKDVDDTFVHPPHAIAKKNVDLKVIGNIFAWFGECM